MDKKPQERRKYRRIKSFFNVDFTILRLQGGLPGLDWEKGQVRDVSEGGICLETTALSESTIKFLNKEDISLDLRIHAPDNKIVKMIGHVAWFKKEEKVEGKYTIGIEFRSIIQEDLKKLMGYTTGLNGIVVALIVSSVGLLIWAICAALMHKNS